MAIHKYVRIADSELSKVGGISGFDWYDGYLCGSPEEVFATLESFSSNVHEHCGLELERSKTEVLCMDTDLPQSNPRGLVQAGITVSGKWEPGFICYGVPIGSDVCLTHAQRKNG